MLSVFLSLKAKPWLQFWNWKRHKNQIIDELPNFVSFGSPEHNKITNWNTKMLYKTTFYQKFTKQLDKQRLINSRTSSLVNEVIGKI